MSEAIGKSRKQRRRALLVFPLVVIPFLTLAFWALGGGRSGTPAVPAAGEGLKTRLPEGQNEEKLAGKLSFYEQARKDSLRIQEWLQTDPHYRPEEGPAVEEQVLEKVETLRRQMELPGAAAPPAPRHRPALSGEVDRLEALMQSLQRKEEDPEIRNLEGVLDKILDIQHPDRLQARREKPEVDTSRYTPVRPGSGIRFSLLGEEGPSGKRFYGWDPPALSFGGNAIPAVVDGSQRLAAGAVIRLRLGADLRVGEHVVPSGTRVYGTCSLAGERLQVAIPSLVHGGSVYPVRLQVYDLDGMKGLFVPGAPVSEVARESADRSLQALGLGSLDPSFRAQATAAGLQAAKSLFSKKTKQVRVQVRDGYRLLLQNENF